MFMSTPPPTNSSSAPNWRLRSFVLIMMLCTLVIVGRLIQLQVAEHGRWLATANSIQEKTFEVMPRRGSIYDSRGELLAFDTKAVSIAADSFNMTKPETIISILHKELGIDISTLQKKVYRPSYFTWIVRKINLYKAQRIQKQAMSANALGLIFIDTWKRCYPQQDLASNVLGFVGTDGHGLEGIELQFNEHLAGTPSQVHVLKGADGRTYDVEIVEPGTSGRDLRLSLDSQLQLICEEEIDRGVAEFRAHLGFMVLVDPYTGEVLAMAQDRRYDPNNFSSSTAEQRKNLAISFLFEPGSTFKAFTALTALDTGTITVEDSFNGNDPVNVAGHIMHNAEYKSYGTVKLPEVIEKSINTAMIRIASKLQEEQLYAKLVILGFGSSTGIDLPGEESGILREVDDWSGLALAATSIGQSIAVTGLQLAQGMAAIANRGVLTPTRILPACYPVTLTPTHNRQSVASFEATHTLCNLMQKVVSPTGTAARAEIPGFRVAGKSGTAQKAIPGQGYIDGKYTSLFVGFLPAESPRYLAVVALDEVGTEPFWGGYTSGYVFEQALSRVVKLRQLKPVSME